MSQWFLYFLFYSLAGCGLEKLYARAIRSPRRQRKCFLLLPLCPVYGLAMTAVLALVPADAGLVTLSVLGKLNPTTGALVHNAGSCFVVLIAALLYDRKFE